MFMAVHGHGNGATTLLRGLYERAVTAAYITKDPSKAERFVRYAAIQEHRMMQAAFRIVSEKEFNEVAVERGTSVAEITKLYREIKPEFQTVVCSACKTKRTAGTWDIEVAAMVHIVGDLFHNLYLNAYAIPNLEIHATLASAARDREPHKEADIALMSGWILLGLVIKYQNVFFKLGLDAEIAACEAEIPAVWAPVTGSPQS
jgi:hypothetical protein